MTTTDVHVLTQGYDANCHSHDDPKLCQFANAARSLLTREYDWLEYSVGPDQALIVQLDTYPILTDREKALTEGADIIARVIGQGYERWKRTHYRTRNLIIGIGG